MNRVDPKKFGLHVQTVIEQVDDTTLALTMDRKSRIIMADGRKKIKKIKKIHNLQPGIRIILKTSAPVCSKTLSLFHRSGLTISAL